jgi:hypothetical protein
MKRYWNFDCLDCGVWQLHVAAQSASDLNDSTSGQKSG